MSGSETNYLIPFDTVNRNMVANTNTLLQLNDAVRTLNLFPPENDNITNNVLIDLQTTPQRLPAVSLSVGSLEIPNTQSTIERLWNQVYFSEFYEPLVNPDADTTGQGNMNVLSLQWTLADGTTDHFDATIPFLQNAIVSVAASDATATTATFRFVTKYPHALTLSDQYDWSPNDSYMQLIGTALSFQNNASSIVTMNSSNTYLKLVDDYTFDLVNVPLTSASVNVVVTQMTTPSPTTASSSDGSAYGYLYAPPVPGPYQLTKIINTAIQEHPTLEKNQVQLVFLPLVHQVRFQFSPIVSPTLVTGNQNAIATAFNSVNIGYTNNTLLNPLLPLHFDNDAKTAETFVIQSLSILNTSSAVDSLALQLGFPDTFTITQNVPQRTSVSYFHLSLIKLDTGNYSGQSMVPQLDLQWNRLYFEKPFIPGSMDDYRPKFVFSDESSTLHIIEIPFGFYTPQTFALFLQTRMNALDSLGNTYSVTYNTDTFTFQSNIRANQPKAPVFGLEFGTSLSLSLPLMSSMTGAMAPSVAARLGFLPTNVYRGQSKYSSPGIAYVPQASAFSSAFLQTPLSTSSSSNLTLNSGAFDPSNQQLKLSSSPYNNPYPRSLSFLWQTTYSSATSKFTFHTSIPRTNLGAATYDQSGEQKRVIMTFTQAHGFQTQQPIVVTFPGITGLPNTFTAIVTQVIDAFQLVVDPGSAFNVPIGTGGLTWATLNATPVDAHLNYSPTGNFYMAPLYSSKTNLSVNAVTNAISFNQIPASFLGFPEQDFVWLGTQVPDNSTQLLTNTNNSTFPVAKLPTSMNWQINTFDLTQTRSLFPLNSPVSVDLDGPQYLLLQMLEPDVSTPLQHRYKNDVKTNILAKILIHNSSCHKIERFLHVQGSLRGSFSRLTSVRLLLLNPDHTPYQLHNKNWSGTFSVTALTDRVILTK